MRFQPEFSENKYRSEQRRTEVRGDKREDDELGFFFFFFFLNVNFKASWSLIKN